MSMKKMGRVLLAAVILSYFCSLTGCGKPTEYTVDDIRSVSVSCGHMNYSYSYSFYLRKSENEWLLDAEYATDAENPRVEYEKCPVAENDVKELLDIVRDQDLIKKLYRSKKTKLKVHISDETMYYTSVLFSDGEIMGASAYISQDLETCFRSLAEKYADKISETNKT